MTKTRYDHKVKHIFHGTLNPSCNLGPETYIHYLLHCHAYRNESLTVLNKIKNININNLQKSDTILTQTLPYCDSSFDYNTNTFIINNTEYILVKKRFEGPLFDACHK